MLELMLKLIDKIIQLETRKEQKRAQWFSEVLKPIITDFENVHKNYMDCFKKYLFLIEDKKYSLNSNHPVIEEIKRDNLFSEDLRTKISAKFSRYIDRNEVTVRLKYRIFGYLNWAIDEPEFIEYNRKHTYDVEEIIKNFGSQMIREEVRLSLLEIFSSEQKENMKRNEAITAIKISTIMLQRKYKAVIYEYERLKNEMLTNRSTGLAKARR